MWRGPHPHPGDQHRRRVSRVAGILLLVGLAAGVLSVVPVIEEPDFLPLLSGRVDEVARGALFQGLMVPASAGFALALHSLLRRTSPAMSLGFVVFRLISCGFHVLAIAALALLLHLGEAVAAAPAAEVPSYAVIAETLRHGQDLINHVVVIVTLALGDLLLFTTLYRQRLAPRWLGAWGLVGAMAAIGASALLVARAVDVVSVPYLALTAPAAAQTVVFAVWLVARGIGRRGH